MVREEAEDRKGPQDAHEAGGDGRNRGRLGDQEPGPGIEKSRQRTVGIAHVHILAARLRFHGAQFGVGERAEERQHSADQPRQIDQLGRADRLHHFGRNQKDSAADDGAHDHRGSVAHAQIAEAVQGGMELTPPC